MPVLKNDKISNAFLNLKFNSTRTKIKGEIQDTAPVVVAVAIVFSLQQANNGNEYRTVHLHRYGNAKLK